MSFTNSQYINWIDRCAAALAVAQDELTALDTAIGDGDHGLNMHRGFSKAQEKLAAEAGKDLGSLSKSVGMTLLSTVGGASGSMAPYSSRLRPRSTAKAKPICQRWRKPSPTAAPDWSHAVKPQRATKRWWTSGCRWRKCSNRRPPAV